jgi:hypothetical protein
VTCDLVFGVSRRDYVRISRQAFGAAFLGTALQATDLLYARGELGFPDRLRDFGIIASVEDIIDRVCATGAVTLARRSGEVLALPVKRQKREEACKAHLNTVPSLTSPSSSSDMGRPRVRLAARDCAGEAAAEGALEDAPEAMREAVFFDTVLWLSRARLRRSRIVM